MTDIKKALPLLNDKAQLPQGYKATTGRQYTSNY